MALRAGPAACGAPVSSDAGARGRPSADEGRGDQPIRSAEREPLADDAFLAAAEQPVRP